MYDVAVAGASVAGSAVATALARMGLRVVVVEKRAAGGRKACGEGLFPAGVRALAGFVDRDVPEGAAISGVRFSAGGHVATGHFRGGEGQGIDRSALDVALRGAAACAGAEIREGVTVTGLAVAGGRVRALETNHGPVKARAFVAADGLGSRLRRLSGLGLPGVGRRYGVSAHIGADGPPGGFVDVVVDRGYELYVTPIGARRWNVAVLTDREGMAALAGDLRGGFEALLARHAPELPPGSALADVPLAAGPFPRGSRRTWRGNLVLAGDAAGFYDGISGEGMTAALISAQACAEAVAAYLASGSRGPLREYERQRRAVVRNADLVARLTLTLGRSPRTAAWSVRNLERRPETFDRLLALSSGEMGLRGLRPRDVAALALGI